MKKNILVILILLCVSTAVFAEATESPYYVKSVPIVKVYSVEQGYRLVYMNSSMKYSAVYVPIEWFGGAAAKAEVVYGRSESYPYFSIFWKDGAFDHIRLYLKSDRTDLTWGDVDSTDDISGKFEGVESIELKF